MTREGRSVPPFSLADELVSGGSGSGWVGRLSLFTQIMIMVLILLYDRGRRRPASGCLSGPCR